MYTFAGMLQVALSDDVETAMAMGIDGLITALEAGNYKDALKCINLTQQAIDEHQKRIERVSGCDVGQRWGDVALI